jgi:hypothetical protein
MATICVPMPADAPGRLSTMTDWPSSLPSGSAMART